MSKNSSLFCNLVPPRHAVCVFPLGRYGCSVEELNSGGSDSLIASYLQRVASYVSNHVLDNALHAFLLLQLMNSTKAEFGSG